MSYFWPGRLGRQQQLFGYLRRTVHPQISPFANGARQRLSVSLLAVLMESLPERLLIILSTAISYLGEVKKRGAHWKMNERLSVELPVLNIFITEHIAHTHWSKSVPSGIYIFLVEACDYRTACNER